MMKSLGILQQRGVYHFYFSLLILTHITGYVYYTFRPQSPLVLTPLPTTTTRRPPSVLLPVQTISRPPNTGSPVNPLISVIGSINEVNNNIVDEKHCGQQEISSGKFSFE